MSESSYEGGQVVVYKVYRLSEGGKHAIYASWAEVESEFDGAEFGDRIIVELGAMTPQAIYNEVRALLEAAQKQR